MGPSASGSTAVARVSPRRSGSQPPLSPTAQDVSLDFGPNARSPLPAHVAAGSWGASPLHSGGYPSPAVRREQATLGPSSEHSGQLSNHAVAHANNASANERSSASAPGSTTVGGVPGEGTAAPGPLLYIDVNISPGQP